MRMKIVFVEGNIGCGKTSLLKQIQAKFGACVQVVEEPVDLWEESGLLSNVYGGEVSRTTFQFVALCTKTMALLRGVRAASDAGAASQRIVVAERSPFSDLHVFAEATIESEIDRAAYRVAHREMMSLLDDHTCSFLFLEHASPELLVERIRKRCRGGEHHIDRAFLEDLEARHADLKNTLAASGYALQGLDCTRSPEAVFCDAKEFLEMQLGQRAGEPGAGLK